MQLHVHVIQRQDLKSTKKRIDVKKNISTLCSIRTGVDYLSNS